MSPLTPRGQCTGWPLKAMLFVPIVLAGGWTAGPSRGEEAGDRTVEQYRCKDVMRENGSNREIAIAFLHGFLIGKSGSSTFNVDALRKQTDAFMDHCLDNPNERAVDAMMTIK